MEKGPKPSAAYRHVGVVGAGAWGTALAITAARAGRIVTLWTRDAVLLERMLASRQNDRSLPGAELPAGVRITSSLEAAYQSEIILLAVPAQHLRETLAVFPVPDAVPIVLCAKGIERTSGKLVTEVLTEAAPECLPAILSGPSFARDLAAGLPTAVTVASDGETAVRLQETFSHAAFRPYASDDVVGVALGGAAKNVYAIACGIVCGLGLGDSARAALLARSFSELRRLGRAIGARDETLTGLSGLGDLVLTATSTGSRNFAFGHSLGRGRQLQELRAPGQPLAEGVDTAPALVSRASRLAVELPVAETVAEILSGRLALSEALPRLMARPLKME
ncbi:MAG TPA: NAD(P)H-dependent glycerol-3-phosphate dehydrogenase [Rhizomicrobium sp.]|jgi:glycerol-3-phosphate dehydrogenase (NAD(P)+)